MKHAPMSLSQVALVVKNPPVSTRDADWIPASGRSPAVGNGNLLQYSCLDRGAWQATVHGVSKSWTQLSMNAHTNVKPEASLSLLLLESIF